MADSSETAQTESEAPDSSDKPPHDDIKPQQKPIGNGLPSHPKEANKQPHFAERHSVPLPPPEAGAQPKEPGRSKMSLGGLVLPGAPSKPTGLVVGTGTPSSLDSPSGSDSDSWGASTASTRPPSRAPSRAPSMSHGKSGSQSGLTPNAVAVTKKGADPNAGLVPPPVQGVPHPEQTIVGATKTKRSASVNSDGGHKFTLKDLLASGPKLTRKSSARSASSKKSDSDGGARSTAGDSTGSLLKKYGVCERVAIGKGATSVVRLAHKWDRTEEKLYAVKEFRKRRKNETEKEYVKKLTAEFCISSTLHHVNIVETVDLVQDENQHWCEVMEFCPGGDLYAAIKKGGMSPSEVECCFKQILNGVAYLHSQGVAHRDIKPENLFFDAKGQLKIGDYGASTVYRLPWESTVHMSTGLCGSEPYIAPEQFNGKPYDARLVDIWACGIVYYCLHFQELPWRVAQTSDPLYAAYASACASSTPAHSACPTTINNLSPRACRPLIRKMLDPDPKQRWTIEQVIAHPWVQSIDVCHTMEKPNHVHVHARSFARAQV